MPHLKIESVFPQQTYHVKIIRTLKKILQLHVSRKKLLLIPTIMLSVNTGTPCIHFQYDNTLIVNTYYIIMLVVGKIYLNCF